MKQISFELENKPHQLSRAVGMLAASKVELRALTVGHTPSNSSFGLAKMIVSKVDTATAILEEGGMRPVVEDVIVTAVEDHSGGLHSILRILDEAGINIEHMYAFVSRVEGKALSVFTFADYPRAADILRSGGVRLIDADSPEELEEYALGDVWDLEVGW